MENLLECSKVLNSELKFKSTVVLPVHPVLISMNGSSLVSIFKFCQDEQEAFTNRAVFIYMSKNIEHRISTADLEFLGSSGGAMVHILTRIKDKKLSDKQNRAPKDYTGSIFI